MDHEFSAPATPPATPPPAPSPTAAIVIAAGRDKVWTALTDPRAIADYQPEVEVESDWVQGADITWRGARDGQAFTIQGTITGFDPDTALTFTAGEGDQARTVTVRVDGGEMSSEVSVADSRPGDPMQDWSAWLARLKEYLERTESLDSSNVMSRDAADR